MIAEYRSRHILIKDANVEWSSWRPLPEKIDIPLGNTGWIQFEFRVVQRDPAFDIVAQQHNAYWISSLSITCLEAREAG